MLMVIIMKIILSPAKTMKPVLSEYLTSSKLLYPKEHKKVLTTLRKLTKSDIKSIMKIDKDLLNQTYHNIKNYSSLEEGHAFTSYDGLVFKGLKKDTYNEGSYNYIKEHVRILDGFYGVLQPGTLIKPYRLDMKMKIGLNLYKHFDIDGYFKDEVILNLASDEYSKMISLPMINISFLQQKENKYVNQATYSKQARGIFLNYLITNQINDIIKLKSFTEEGYKYNQELSDEYNYVFTR